MIVDELPFTPYNDTLRNILRKKNIRQVTGWLLGSSEDRILAQEGNSSWGSGSRYYVFCRG